MSSSASAASSSNRSNRRDNNNNDYKMKKKIKKNTILLLSSLTNEMKPLSLIIDTDVVKNKPKSYVDVPQTQFQSEPFSKAYEDTWFSFTKKWYPIVLVGNKNDGRNGWIDGLIDGIHESMGGWFVCMYVWMKWNVYVYGLVDGCNLCMD